MTLAAWLASASAANKAKVENKARKMYSESTYNRANREDKEKKMKMASDFIEKTTRTPLLNMDISSTLAGMVAVIKLHQKMETSTKPSSTELFSGGGLDSCDKALLRLGPVERTAVLKGTTRKFIRWHEGASGAYLFLHHNIYGLGYMKERAASVARALGVRRHTTKTWFSLGDNKSHSYMEKWVPLVREMNWKDAEGSCLVIYKRLVGI